MREDASASHFCTLHGPTTHLAQSLYKPHCNQPPLAPVGCHWHQEAEQRVDEHTDAQEVDAAVLLRQQTERYLGDYVAVEERAEDVALDVRRPHEGTVTTAAV